jgi:hypothetical protein
VRVIYDSNGRFEKLLLRGEGDLDIVSTIIITRVMPHIIFQKQKTLKIGASQ